MNYESVTTHKVRLRGLIAELEAEEGAEQGGGGGRSYVLLHLRALQDEVGEAMGAAAGAGGGGEAAAEEAAGEDAALQAEALEALSDHAEALHVALCRTEAEAQRRIGQAEAAAESDLRRAEAEAAEQAGRLAAAARREAESVAAAERLEAELRRVSERAAAALREAEQASARLEGRLKEAEAEAEASRAERAAVEARASQARREADAAVAQESGGWREERAYVRTLMIRYMELESEHEALFPAIATVLHLTRDEVARIRAAQEAHASATSVWGRTVRVGSSLWGAASEVATEVSKYRTQQGGS
mmetsp:Transcript_14105/g.45506  ORF Transcript_14105/g.45506 Transcript_14105/m.45506 type:complete len:304 (-) Transcript_14105:151-1062(-)